MQRSMSISDEYALARANFIGNYVTAPNGDGLVHGCAFLPTGKGFAVFAEGNLGPHLQDGSGKQSAWFSNIKGDVFVAARHAAPVVTIHTATEARLLVLEGAGATMPVRDAVDNRAVEDVRAGRTRIVDHPDQVGGWPTLQAGMRQTQGATLVASAGEEPVIGLGTLGACRTIATTLPWGGHNFSNMSFRSWLPGQRLLANLVEWAATARSPSGRR